MPLWSIDAPECPSVEPQKQTREEGRCLTVESDHQFLFMRQWWLPAYNSGLQVGNQVLFPMQEQSQMSLSPIKINTQRTGSIWSSLRFSITITGEGSRFLTTPPILDQLYWQWWVLGPCFVNPSTHQFCFSWCWVLVTRNRFLQATESRSPLNKRIRYIVQNVNFKKILRGSLLSNEWNCVFLILLHWSLNSQDDFICRLAFRGGNIVKWDHRVEP